MNEPIIPLPAPDIPERRDAGNTGQGAQTALAALIRKRRMGENHIADEPVQAASKQIPAA